MPAELPRRMGTAAALLAGFAVVGAAMVAYTWQSTHERIAANERAVLLRSLAQVLPPPLRSEGLAREPLQVTDPELLGTEDPVPVYRAWQDGRPVAVVVSPVAPDGYSGPIRLLVGILPDGTVSGVRVVSHRETPGLGDKIEAERSDWILDFAGRSLGAPPEEDWTVKRDGGAFDQFTGATITPRAVVKAVRNALLYFEAHRDQLLSASAAPASPAGTEQDTLGDATP
ncbi:MAG: electron transport complex subunit RsxG [Gammaproteobacteria bacterium]